MSGKHTFSVKQTDFVRKTDSRLFAKETDKTSKESKRDPQKRLSTKSMILHFVITV